jgi:hypothetical protein
MDVSRDAWEFFELRGRTLVCSTAQVKDDYPLHLLDEGGKRRRIVFSSEEAAHRYAEEWARVCELRRDVWSVCEVPVDDLPWAIPVLLDPSVRTQPGRHVDLYELL